MPSIQWRRSRMVVMAAAALLFLGSIFLLMGGKRVLRERDTMEDYEGKCHVYILTYFEISTSLEESLSLLLSLLLSLSLSFSLSLFLILSFFLLVSHFRSLSSLPIFLSSHVSVALLYQDANEYRMHGVIGKFPDGRPHFPYSPAPKHPIDMAAELKDNGFFKRLSDRWLGIQTTKHIYPFIHSFIYSLAHKLTSLPLCSFSFFLFLPHC